MSKKMWVVTYTMYGKPRRVEVYAETAGEAVKWARGAYPKGADFKASIRRAF